MCKFHQWEPIYKTRPVYKENKKYLYGICMNCKKVVSAEYLIRRLNIYERECKDMEIEFEIVSDEQLGEKDE